LLSELLLSVGVVDTAGLAEQIDEASRSVLDPDYAPSPSDPPTS